MMTLGQEFPSTNEYPKVLFLPLFSRFVVFTSLLFFRVNLSSLLKIDRRKRTCAVTVDGRKERERELDHSIDADMQPTNKSASRVKPKKLNSNRLVHSVLVSA